MTPTPRLRFVEREEIVSHAQMIVKKVRVLQQYYVPAGGDKTSDHYKGEWRDVPLEKEE